MVTNNVILIAGQEGAGKSTLVRALLPLTCAGAQIDAEDVGQVNPCLMDTALLQLLRRNVAQLVLNFWAAGYRNVIAGSIANTHSEYVAFRDLLPPDTRVYLVQLRASRAVRDRRRMTRAKPSAAAWRDHVDRVDPEDTSLRSASADYRLIVINTDDLTIDETVAQVVRAIPEIYESEGGD